MDEHAFALLKDRARDDWIRFECHHLDLVEASRSARKKAKRLAWLTIILAAATTLTSGAAVQGFGVVAWVATGLAALTTLVAAIRQTFKWEEMAQRWHERSLEIRNLQRTLQDYLEAISRLDAEEDFTFLTSLNSRFDKLLDPEVDQDNRFRAQASQQWQEGHTSRLELSGAKAAAEDSAMPPIPELADVDEAAVPQGIEPIRRGGSRQ